MTPRDLARIPEQPFFYAAEPVSSVAAAYGEIERLAIRVEAWERAAVEIAETLTADAEQLTKRVRGVVAGPRSPNGRLEKEMARIALRIERLERPRKGDLRISAPLHVRVWWRMRNLRRRLGVGRNKDVTV